MSPTGFKGRRGRKEQNVVFALMVAFFAPPQSSVLRRQVLVLEDQFLVHQSRYIRQQISPLIAFHGNCPIIAYF